MMRLTMTSALLLTAVLAGTAAGCSSDQDASGSSSTMPSTASEAGTYVGTTWSSELTPESLAGIGSGCATVRQHVYLNDDGTISLESSCAGQDPAVLSGDDTTWSFDDSNNTMSMTFGTTTCKGSADPSEMTLECSDGTTTTTEVFTRTN